MNEWVWFCGVLLPEGYKDLVYLIYKPFIHIDEHLENFVDQPITDKLRLNNIGKIKSVWKDDEGRLLIGGYIKSCIKYDYINIHLRQKRCVISGEPHIRIDFGCSIVENPIYKGCRILQKYGGSLPFLQI